MASEDSKHHTVRFLFEGLCQSLCPTIASRSDGAEAFADISEHMLIPVWKDVDYGLDICRVMIGAHIESLHEEAVSLPHSSVFIEEKSIKFFFFRRQPFGFLLLCIVMANGFHLKHYIALAALVRTGNFTVDFFNMESDANSTAFQRESLPPDEITSIPAVKAFFYCLYITIFVTGVFGNVLVCYVVFRNKGMHTVTNLFIANLALSDILLCMFAVPFTPMYLLMHEWVFGAALCHLVPYAQGVSVYISAFTLMSIAIDRFFVIIHPFKPRLQIQYSLLIIAFIWLGAGMLTLPYGIFIDLIPGGDGRPYCDERWPHDSFRKAFGFTTSVMQFVIPFLIITYCYFRVCCKLRDRARYKPGANCQRKIEQEWERTRRLNRMLISMVLIFGISWLPLNVHNLVVDFYIPATNWEYLNGFFFLSHAVAMSSTCYNPFLYAWLNENFRKEFQTVLPFLNDQAMCQMCARESNNETLAPKPECSHQEIQPNGETSTQREIATSLKYTAETNSVRMQVQPKGIITAV